MNTTNSTQFFHPTWSNPAIALLLATAALALTVHTHAAPKPKPPPSQYATRYFEVRVFDEIWDSDSNSWIANPARAFWQVDPRQVGTYSDEEVRIGRIESPDWQGVLINHNVCGGRGGQDGCPAALALILNLQQTADDGSNLSATCFPGDPQYGFCDGCEIGSAAVHPPGFDPDDPSAFRFEFEGRNTAGNKQQYKFRGFAVSVSSNRSLSSSWSYQDLLIGDWVETEIGNWSLARTAGPGGSQSACHGTGTFDTETHRVRVLVLRIQ